MLDSAARPHVTRPVRATIAAVLGLALFGCGGSAGDSERADGAAAQAVGPPRVAILEPEDGAELDGASVLMVLSAENIELAPAGDPRPGTGHHHLFVNAPVLPDPGQEVPIGLSGIIHLGQAQTSYELTTLAPGEYMVIAVLGDLAHRRIEPQTADTVRFRVR